MFKKLFSTAAALALFVGGAQATDLANIKNLEGIASQIVLKAQSTSEAPVAPTNLMWQVGEYHNFDVSLGSFGKLGSGTKTVTQDVPAEDAFWYVTEMSLMGQVQKTEALMRRSDGKVLKLIVNGEEQNPDEGGESEVEIVEQYQTTTETPAGTFECWYIKANITSDGKTQVVQIWINPTDVNLDGTLRLKAETNMGEIELLLTAFGKQ